MAGPLLHSGHEELDDGDGGGPSDVNEVFNCEWVTPMRAIQGRRVHPHRPEGPLPLPRLPSSASPSRVYRPPSSPPPPPAPDEACLAQRPFPSPRRACLSCVPQLCACTCLFARSSTALTNAARTSPACPSSLMSTTSLGALLRPVFTPLQPVHGARLAALLALLTRRGQGAAMGASSYS